MNSEPKQPLLPISQRITSNPVQNLSALYETDYIGRMIISGKGDNGNYFFVYGLTGRSKNSKNRRIVSGPKGLWTEFVEDDPSAQPDLVLYDVALWTPEDLVFVLSNGAQTKTVHDEMVTQGTTFISSLEGHEHEPDGPIFTPRITTVLDLDEGLPTGHFASFRQTLDGEGHDRQFWSFDDFEPGVGRCLTTYERNSQGDEEGPPLFRGEPFKVPLTGSRAEIADTYWSALHEDYCTSVAVVEIHCETGEILGTEIINMHGDAK